MCLIHLDQLTNRINVATLTSEATREVPLFHCFSFPLILCIVNRWYMHYWCLESALSFPQCKVSICVETDDLGICLLNQFCCSSFSYDIRSLKFFFLLSLIKLLITGLDLLYFFCCRSSLFGCWLHLLNKLSKPTLQVHRRF